MKRISYDHPDKDVAGLGGGCGRELALPCSACFRESRCGANYCEHCGAALMVVSQIMAPVTGPPTSSRGSTAGESASVAESLLRCAECGHGSHASAKFCGQCGAQLHEPAAHDNPLKSGICGQPDNLDLTQQESDYWEDKAGYQTMLAVDWFLKAIKNRYPALACSVGKAYISIVPTSDARRTGFIFYPQKEAIVFAARIPSSESIKAAFVARGAVPMPSDETAGRSRISVPVPR